MAVYIKARKIEQTKEYVLYQYGKNPDRLNGKLKILSESADFEILQSDDDEINGFLASRIAVKIWRFYMDNGKFPEQISRQS